MKNMATISAAILAAALPLFADNAATAPDDGLPFGVCSHPHKSREINIREPLFDKMKEARVQWLRDDFSWWKVEEKKGEFDFKVFDEIMDSLDARKIKMLGILTEHSTDGQSAFGNRKEWLKYIAATVEHFKGRVQYWEILNEPDLHKGTPQQAAEYGKMLKEASALIRKIDPSAKIVYTGLAFGEKEYLEASFKECDTSNFDAIGIHTYPAPTPPEGTIAARVKILNETMDRFGGRKPIWITEIGATTCKSAMGINLTKAAAKKFGLDKKQIVAMKFGAFNSAPLAKQIFPKAKSVKKIGLKKIKSFDENCVLVLPAGQHFPSEFVKDIADFVKIGGSVIHIGGYPFIFDDDGRNLGNKGLSQIGANITPHWSFSPKLPSRVKLREAKNLQVIDNADISDLPTLRCFDFDDKFLPAGAKIIPIVRFEINGKTITPAAAYKMPSGGYFVGISSDDSNYVSDDYQAAALVRNYIYSLSAGVKKIFNYNFRSHGEVSLYEGSFGLVRKDLTEKPSFRALRTLTTLVGAHAKISYKETGNVCRADWISPDGRPVCALWLKRGLPKKTELSLSSDKFKIMEISGKIIENDNAKGKTKLGVKLSTTPVYIIGANNITL